MEPTYRKVSAKENLPEKEGNYFIYVAGKEYDEHNQEEVEYTMGKYSYYAITFEGKRFTGLEENEIAIYWLEEIKPEKLIERDITAKDFINAVDEGWFDDKGRGLDNLDSEIAGKKCFALAQQMCEAKDKEVEELKKEVDCYKTNMEGHAKKALELNYKLNELKSKPSKSIEQCLDEAAKTFCFESHEPYSGINVLLNDCVGKRKFTQLESFIHKAMQLYYEQGIRQQKYSFDAEQTLTAVLNSFRSINLSGNQSVHERQSAKSVIQSYADKQSKNDAVEFAKWISHNRYWHDTKNSGTWYKMLFNSEAVDIKNKFTTEELYGLLKPHTK